MEKKKILVVYPYPRPGPLRRYPYERLLGDRYELVWVETGEEGMKYLAAQEVPVVVLGRWVDGMGFLQDIRQKIPAVVRILVGCDCVGCEKLAKEALKEGVAERYFGVEWLLKPEHVREFELYLEQAFEEYRVRKERVLP